MSNTHPNQPLFFIFFLIKILSKRRIKNPPKKGERARRREELHPSCLICLYVPVGWMGGWYELGTDLLWYEFSTVNSKKEADAVGAMLYCFWWLVAGLPRVSKKRDTGRELWPVLDRGGGGGIAGGVFHCSLSSQVLSTLCCKDWCRGKESSQQGPIQKPLAVGTVRSQTEGGGTPRPLILPDVPRY